MHDHTAGDPTASFASPMAEVLTTLQLFGHPPNADEPDRRPLPAPEALEAIVSGLFAVLPEGLAETRREDDLPDLLWAPANRCHRRLERIERDLDDNEQAQRRSQAEQDFFSEVRSVNLDRLTDHGLALIARRESFEEMREATCRHYTALVGAPWLRRAGSLVARPRLTSAVIGSRAFLEARRRTQAVVLVPGGTRVTLTGGPTCEDHRSIWAKLDRVHTKYPSLVLLHGGSPRGAEHIAALWARQRQVSQVVFKPDWTRHRKAAPFKRNDALLDTLLIGVMVFPGNGISENLADKARAQGIRGPPLPTDEDVRLTASAVRLCHPPTRPFTKLSAVALAVEKISATSATSRRRGRVAGSAAYKTQRRWAVGARYRGLTGRSVPPNGVRHADFCQRSSGRR